MALTPGVNLPLLWRLKVVAVGTQDEVHGIPNEMDRRGARLQRQVGGWHDAEEDVRGRVHGREAPVGDPDLGVAPGGPPGPPLAEGPVAEQDELPQEGIAGLV